MNIGNSLGVAGSLGNLNGAGMAGEFQSVADSLSQGSEGSLFQKLISQMLAQKNLSSENGAAAFRSGITDQSTGTGDFLSRLLLAGGNLTKLSLQNPGEEIDTAAVTGEQQGEVSVSDEKVDQSAVIQALIYGLNGAPAANREPQNSGMQNGPIVGQTPDPAIGAVWNSSSASGAIENQNHMAVSSQTAGNADKFTLFSAGEADQTDAAKLSRQNGETTALQEADPLGSGNAGNLKTEKQELNFWSRLNLSGVTNGRQAASEANPAEEQIAAPIDKLQKQDENRAGTHTDMDLLNPLQNAGSASEASKPSPFVQTADRTEPYSQISGEILTKLEQKGPNEFTMQLEPEDLGQIDIKLKLSNGKLMIDILAANSKTQALLTSQVDKLISSMGLQNVQVESVQVSQQMNTQNQGSQSQGYLMNSGMDFSQRRQQEPFQQELAKGGSLSGTDRSRLSESEGDSMINRIDSVRYDFHRMNYAV